MGRKRPTMKDVAALAGVTQPTVSYVINATAPVSDEVKRRVNAAIKELDYQPNTVARALKTQKSTVIGILIPDILNQFYAQVVDVIERLLSGLGYTVIISSTRYDQKAAEESLLQMAARNVAGVIVCYQLDDTSVLEGLFSRGLHVALLEGGSDVGPVPCVNTDNVLGGKLAAAHLLRRGCKKLAFLGQNEEIEAVSERCAGFLSVIADDAGNIKPTVYATTGPIDKWTVGMELAENLIRDGIDGVAVSSDAMAAGVLRALLLAGLKVPGDIAVIGYDNIALSEFLSPALTTVEQPIAVMCEAAISALLDDGGERCDIRIPPRLVVRESA